MNFHLEFSLCKEAPVQRLLLAIVKTYYPNLFLSLVQRDREFLVKWRGWGSEWNSWEPEGNFLSPVIIR